MDKFVLNTFRRLFS